MGRKSEQDYTARHEKIVNKLIQLAEERGQGCFPVSKLANELGMDQRTVKSHLKIIEMDNAGVFVDPDQKEFCTRVGVILLAKRLGIGDGIDKASG